MNKLQFIAQEIKLAESYINGNKLENTDDFHYYQGYADGIVLALESLGLAKEINKILDEEDEDEGK